MVCTEDYAEHCTEVEIGIESSNEDGSEVCFEDYIEECSKDCNGECTGDGTEDCFEVCAEECFEIGTEDEEGTVYDAFLGRDLLIFGLFLF